jgi:hypothetical protein
MACRRREFCSRSSPRPAESLSRQNGRLPERDRIPTLRHEVAYINANLELAERGAINHLRLQGWCRALPEDVRLAFSNCPGLKHITLSASSSDTMIRAKFGNRKDWNSVRAQMMQAVRLAIEYGAETSLCRRRRCFPH